MLTGWKARRKVLDTRYPRGRKHIEWIQEGLYSSCLPWPDRRLMGWLASIVVSAFLRTGQGGYLCQHGNLVFVRQKICIFISLYVGLPTGDPQATKIGLFSNRRSL
jgi:hypothetical protein